MNRLALVEPDGVLADRLAHELAERPFAVTRFHDAASFREGWRNGTYEVVVLAWDLPDTDGVQVLRSLREQADWYLPIIIVTPDDTVERALGAFAAGADDVVSAAVHPRLFAARLGALCRRSLEDPRTVQIGEFRIDRTRRTITRNGNPINLTDKEFALADLLLSNPDQILTRDYLLNAVWACETDSATRTVDTHASRVRHKLGLSRHNELWLRPVYGQGYKLVRQAERHCA